MKKLFKQLLPFCSLVLIIVIWGMMEPERFLTAKNFANVLRRSSVNGIMAAGMTYVIISGGIDLSVGSMMAFCGMIGSMVMLMVSGATWEQITGGSYVELTGVSMWIGTFAGMATGAVCGLANGALITKLKLAPFIVTLGTMSIFRGVTYLMNDGKPFAVSDYEYLDMGYFMGIPSSIALLILIFVIAGFMLKYMRFGRYTYAIGSNAETAFHSGVNVSKVLILVYALVGTFSGLASMITTSRASSSQPTAGIALELDIIAAVIIGGCSPAGGSGTMIGTVIGTFLISFLRNGLTLIDVSTNVQLVVIGLIIIFAVTADQLATQRRNS